MPSALGSDWALLRLPVRSTISSVVPQMFDSGTVKYSAPPSLTSITNACPGSSRNRPAT